VGPGRTPPHWGNHGSVASVVIETPHRGAFTPILECEFDLAYTPLLEWRDGRGEVVFCQLDLTGRIGHEPAADLLAGNLIRYLVDRPASRNQDKSVVFLGDARSAAFIRGLGLQVVEEQSRLSPESQVAVVGPDHLSAVREKLSAFVRSGGTAIVLPQDAKQWPADGGVRLAPRKVTRVLHDGASPMARRHWPPVAPLPHLPRPPGLRRGPARLPSASSTASC